MPSWNRKPRGLLIISQLCFAGRLGRVRFLFVHPGVLCWYIAIRSRALMGCCRFGAVGARKTPIWDNVLDTLCINSYGGSYKRSKLPIFAIWCCGEYRQGGVGALPLALMKKKCLLQLIQPTFLYSCFSISRPNRVRSKQLKISYFSNKK